MTASCESVTDLMLPKVSGNSPSTLCKLLIEFVLVVKSSFQAWQLLFLLSLRMWKMIISAATCFPSCYRHGIVLLKPPSKRAFGVEINCNRSLYSSSYHEPWDPTHRYHRGIPIPIPTYWLNWFITCLAQGNQPETEPWSSALTATPPQPKSSKSSQSSSYLASSKTK